MTTAVLIWFYLKHPNESGGGSAPDSGSVRSRPAIAPQAVIDDTPSPASAASAAGISRGKGEIEVCGGGWVKVQPDGSIDPAEVDRATHAPQARAAILAQLNAGPSEIARLAGMLMAAIDRDSQHRVALLGLPTNCEGEECAAAQAAEDEVAQVREAIARAALTSSAPKVYALALNVCGNRREGACQLLGARQLARLDPGNASPWLRVLEEAGARKDAAEQAEALFRIASADRNESGWLTLSGEVLKVTPGNADDTSTFANFAMVVSAVGVEGAWSMRGYSSVGQLCRADALRDANRAQVCAGVASVLAERSDTVIGRNIGGAIGTRLGWPAERVDRMRGEYNAYVSSSTSAGDEPGTELGCGRIRRDLDRLRKTAMLGEVGALREWVSRSGKKPGDFVREERARQHQAQRFQAEAAASAAASATR